MIAKHEYIHIAVMVRRYGLCFTSEFNLLNIFSIYNLLNLSLQAIKKQCKFKEVETNSVKLKNIHLKPLAWFSLLVHCN